MSYLDCLPPDLRRTLNLIPPFDHSPSGWNIICESGSAKLVLQYFELLREGRFRHWTLNFRPLDRLLEWESQKLIEKLIEKGDMSILLDLTSTASRLGDMNLLIRLTTILKKFQTADWYNGWCQDIIEYAIENSQWGVVEYLLRQGYSMSTYYLGELAYSLSEEYQILVVLQKLCGRESLVKY